MILFIDTHKECAFNN